MPMSFCRGSWLGRCCSRGAVVGGGNRDEEGCRGSGVAMNLYPMARSAMLVAMGPTTPTEGARLGVGTVETRPCVGFKPVMPQ